MTNTHSLDAAGRLPRAHQIPSPNCDERPSGAEVILLVVHGISLPPHEFGGEAVVDLFLNRLELRLRETGIQVKRYRKPTFARIAPLDLKQEISSQCDAVIEALAD